MNDQRRTKPAEIDQDERKRFPTPLGLLVILNLVFGFLLPSAIGSPIATTNLTQDVRLNLRGAPLESVVRQLGEAAGFIVESQTDLRGKVDVWSGQPVTKAEALDLLNSALDKNGYAGVISGRTLTIYNKEAAKKRDLPVKSGNRAEAIPRNAEMVTQIIPLRFLSASQVSRDLQALVPVGATMTANEGANALVITDIQMNIHRLVEIINALDTAVSSVTSIRVFPLKYADAKTVASVIKDLFQPQDTSRSGSQGQSRAVNTLQASDPDVPDFGGAGSVPGRGNSSASTASGTAPGIRVVAVAEEHSNAVVISASDSQMVLAEHVIRQVDINVQEITELRVFHLKNADAQETADLLANLFGDSNSSSTSGGAAGQLQFSGPFAGVGAQTGSSSSETARLQKQNRVAAIADVRTGALVVSAARDLMVQIGKVLADLDADAARKQRVFVYSFQHGDVQGLQDILAGLFPASSNGGSSSSATSSTSQNGAGAQLRNRASQNQSQRSGSTGSSSSFGNTSGGLGGSTSR